MYSLTQSGNLGVIIGMIMLILQYFHVNISQSELQTVAGGLLAIAGVLTSWYGRYRKGDLTFAGFRK